MLRICIVGLKNLQVAKVGHGVPHKPLNQRGSPGRRALPLVIEVSHRRPHGDATDSLRNALKKVFRSA